MNTRHPHADIRAQIIFPLLQKVLFGSLSSFHGDAINSRFMIFACTEYLNAFYCLTHLQTEKVAEIAANPQATLSVLSTSTKLDDYSETIVMGSVAVMAEFNHPDVQEGLKMLATKSATIQTLLNRGRLDPYCVLKLTPRQVVFRVYQDVIQNAPKTILTF